MHLFQGSSENQMWCHFQQITRVKKIPRKFSLNNIGLFAHNEMVYNSMLAAKQ